MESMNSKRKHAENNKNSNKSRKRHHLDHAQLSSVDKQAALQLTRLRNRNTRNIDAIASTSIDNLRKQHAGSDTPDISGEDLSSTNPNYEAEKTSKSKCDTYLKQPKVAKLPHSSADEAPLLRLKNDKPSNIFKARPAKEQQQVHRKTLESPADEAPAITLEKFKVEPVNTFKPKSVKEAIKQQQISNEDSDSSADEALAVNLKMAKTKPTNTSKAPPASTVTKQQKAANKALRSSADQAPAVKPIKARASKKIAQKQKVPSPELSSLDEGDPSIADPTDAGADAALLPPPEQASGKGYGSKDDSKEGSEDGADEKAEDEDEDEETQAARLEAEAEATAHFRKNRLVSNPESDTNSESSTEWASDAVFESDGEAHSDNKKKEIFKADDPNAFSSSMTGILDSKLTRTLRANPILARSADAKEADEALLDLKLERKARAEMRRRKVEKGGWDMDPKQMLKEIHGGGAGDLIGSTLGMDDVVEMGGSVSAYQQREKNLRKTAEKGVVKMFNAFSSARGKTVEAEGLVGSRAKKEEKATKMTKEGWLEYVGLGGKGESEKMVELEKKGKGEEA